MAWFALLCLAVALILTLCFWRSRIFSRLPPGPSGWPLVGNGLQLCTNETHKLLTDWARTYGDVYTINAFGSPVVVVSGEGTIREVLIQKSKEFSGRPAMFRIDYVFERKDISFSDCTPRWKVMKKTTTQYMRMYGDGLHRLEEITIDIVQDLLQEFREKNCEAFDPDSSIRFAALNIVLLLLLGEKFGRDSDVIRNIMYWGVDVNNEILSPAGSGFELDIFPWLRHFPNKVFRDLNGFKEHFLAKYLKGFVLDHKAKLDPENIGGILDSWLENLKAGVKCSEGELVFAEDNLASTMANMIPAGMMTSSATMCAFLALCAAKPDLQGQLREVILDAIGQKTPTLADKEKMPYVEAMLMELSRYISLVPINVPHQATQDTSIQDHPIPKGTTVWANFWNLHHDERYWDEPWEFKPERFLDEDGCVVAPNHPVRRRYLPFGAGYRVCLGEVMAKNRLFLMITSILQHFDIQPEGEEAMPEYDPRNYDLGLVLYPKKYKIRAIPLQ